MACLRGLPRSVKHPLCKFCRSQRVSEWSLAGYDKAYTSRVSYFSGIQLRLAYSVLRFPAPSFRLWQNWLRHLRGTLYLHAAVHRRCQRPPAGLSTNKTYCCVEGTSALGKNKKKKEFRHDSNDLGFICAGLSNGRGWGGIKETPAIIWVVRCKLNANRIQA